MTETYIIPLNDLKSSVSEYKWNVNKEFFEEFGNSEISSAELSACFSARKTGGSVELDALITGEVTVPCDRCLDDVVMPVDVRNLLKVRFGDPSKEDEDEEDGREVVWIPAGGSDLDLAQIIYDYVCLSLPIQRCHADGECNPEVITHLHNGAAQAPVTSSDNPFAALKDLMNN